MKLNKIRINWKYRDENVSRNEFEFVVVLILAEIRHKKSNNLQFSQETFLIVNMVKEKPNSTRVFDSDGFRRRAACICVRSELETEVKESLLHFQVTLYCYHVSFTSDTFLLLNMLCLRFKIIIIICLRCYWLHHLDVQSCGLFLAVESNQTKNHL